MNLTFITSNAGKAKYLKDHFSLPVEHRALDLPEIQSLDVFAVAKDKARRAYEIVGAPVLVEDVSLVFSGMKNTLPGPLIKWFFETYGNEGLCRFVDQLGDRSAHASVVFALCDQGGVHTFDASMGGTIVESPRGEAGFGWDPIFVQEGQSKTLAELTEAEKRATSIRRVALEKLVTFLNARQSLTH